jgi:hypothetical protein
VNTSQTRDKIAANFLSACRLCSYVSLFGTLNWNRNVVLVTFEQLSTKCIRSVYLAVSVWGKKKKKRLKVPVLSKAQCYEHMIEGKYKCNHLTGSIWRLMVILTFRPLYLRYRSDRWLGWSDSSLDSPEKSYHPREGSNTGCRVHSYLQYCRRPRFLSMNAVLYVFAFYYCGTRQFRTQHPWNRACFRMNISELGQMFMFFIFLYFICLSHLRAFVACHRANFTLTFYARHVCWCVCTYVSVCGGFYIMTLQTYL